MDITELLAFGVKNKASDLHLSSGLPPMIRVHGDVRRINLPAMEHKDVHSMVYDIMTDTQRKIYEETLECDFSFEIPNLARFRVNAFNQQRGAGAVFRTIPSKILSLEDLNCPKVFKDIAEYPRGIVLVTGPTGSGKSTTLAAMVRLPPCLAGTPMPPTVGCILTRRTAIPRLGRFGLEKPLAAFQQAAPRPWPPTGALP